METTQAGLDHLTCENPMGEARKDALRLNLDRKLKLEFHGTKVISDAGLLAYRELPARTKNMCSSSSDNRSANPRKCPFSGAAIPKTDTCCISYSQLHATKRLLRTSEGLFLERVMAQ